MTPPRTRGMPSVIVCLTTSSIALALLLVGTSPLVAQQPTTQQPKPAPSTQTPRRQQPIEIRGQVPTPQVVTVRPREMPAYSRRVLVPTFFDHDFWGSILPPLEIVTAPVGARVDSVSRARADSTTRPSTSPRPPSGTPPAPRRQ